MTERSNKPEHLKRNKRKQRFFEESRTHFVNEKQDLISKKLESDSLAKVYDKFSKTYRPSIKIRKPKDFAFFGAASQYYQDASKNIIDFYPFDGTREEVIEWHQSSSVVDLALFKQAWPSAVGHFSASYSQYISFYAGPNKIPEAEFVGKISHNETGLQIDPTVGNTIEFWMKKDEYATSSNPIETIFDIGSYPGKLHSTASAQIKLCLSASSGSPLRLTYLVGSSGSSNVQIGSNNVTNSSVADANWHHYALKIWHTGSQIQVKLYIDGEADSTKTISANAMPAVNNYLGGTIATAHGSSSGNFAGSIDDFRFWKGVRSAKETTRFFDKKIYASHATSSDYSNRLGLYYRFNKPVVNSTAVDSLVIDHSGNDIPGRIKNYSQDVRVMTSAITVSDVSNNTEPPDPILDASHVDVSALMTELRQLAAEHDIDNHSLLVNQIPEWAREEIRKAQNPTEFQILLQLMSSEFDAIRIFLESIRRDIILNYQETNQGLGIPQDPGHSGSINYSSNIFVGCTDSDIDNYLSNGYFGDRAQRTALNVGLDHQAFFQKAEKLEDTVEGITEHSNHQKTLSEVRHAFAQRCAIEANTLMKNKGNKASIRSIYSIASIDNTDLTDMHLVPGADIFLQDKKAEAHTSKAQTLNFSNNNKATLFMTSSLSDESTFLTASSAESESGYTFEGCVFFPQVDNPTINSLQSSVFGVREVSGTLNDLTTTAPDRANISVIVERESFDSQRARFKLESNSEIIAENLTTGYKQDVYDGSRWNISVRLRKKNSEPFVSSSGNSYEIVFAGYNHEQSTLVDYFEITSSVSNESYRKFNLSNKTLYLGAQRQNVTGSVTKETDIKVLNFSAWADTLSDEELQIRSKSPLVYGTNRPHLDHNSEPGKTSVDRAILRTQFEALSSLELNNPAIIEDETSGSFDAVISRGTLFGKKYNFKSIGFDTNLSKVLQEDYINHVRVTPIQSLKGVDEVEVKDKDYQKYDLTTRSEVKIFSFEKSAFQSMSRDMYDFLAGVSAYNNVIGEPVNKYRDRYKLLGHLREKFFSNVLSDVDFERYLSYYRWMDSAIGHMLEQMIPGSSFSNVGIENVVESHALERNKYKHKYNRLERKSPNISTNLLGINEMLYDWEHGHATIPDQEGEDDHCLWQKDRKEKSEFRETLQQVLTTVVTGSDQGQYYDDYVLRNLIRPYKHSTDRQSFLTVGQNRKANKIKDLYKIINTGKEIFINSEDIYEFQKCNDVINPQKEKIYTAKTNTTDTEGYLDADADLILPFNLYSSSVGVDFENFKQNLKLTNNHLSPSTIQSVWARGTLGEWAHRSVEIGLTGSDRPEAYELSSSANRLTLKAATGAKSIYSRVHIPGSNFRIGNIKTKISDTKTLVEGNYSKDYEIVMTNGRSLNNNYLVENEGLGLTSSAQVSHYISGTTNYEVPVREKREHVIVNRFSAPGSSESSGPYGLDRTALEYSIYDTVNYRNSLVRDTYNELSKERSEQFGYRSGSNSQASIHKTNRNLRRFTGSLDHMSGADNYYIQHPIPHHDFSYSWITSSVDEGVYSFLDKNGNIPYQHLFSSGSKSNIAFQEISSIGLVNLNAVQGIDATGLTFSHNISTPAALIATDFVGSNLVIVDPLDTETNTIGHAQASYSDLITDDGGLNWGNLNYISRAHTGDHASSRNSFFSGVGTLLPGHSILLNALISNRQGPYGWPTWKQIRGEQHAVARSHKKTNTMSVVFRGSEPFASPHPGSEFMYSRTKEDHNTKTRERKVKNYKEIMATCKFNPITVTMHTLQLEMGIETWAEMPMPRFLPQSWMARIWFQDEYIHETMTKYHQNLNIGTVLLPSISMRATAQNTVTGFANQTMADEIRFEEDEFVHTRGLAMVNEFIRTNSQNPAATYMEVNYIETIYPREINTFTKQARTRERFHFFGWDSERGNRDLILTGNIIYNDFLVSDTERKYFPVTTQISSEDEFRSSYFSLYDKVDLNSSTTTADAALSKNITGSTWVLDGRRNFSLTPVNITSSYFNNGNSFMALRDQGTRAEGILQNDYSIFPLGINTLHGVPPFAPVYNRRIPQNYLGDHYLSGESAWETSNSSSVGPFYNEYVKYAEEIRLVGQEYSLVPEFRISRYIEDALNSSNPQSPAVGEDFLEVTGAVYHTSSGDISIGKQFFKTYSNSDFMKYFQPFRDNVENNGFNLSSGKLTLRCSAVKRLLPYRGFYPAERSVQISEIFNRSYLPETSYDLEYIPNASLTETQSKNSIRKKIENNKSQIAKPLFSPGVLFNSIKTGLAVDYPIFSSSVSALPTYLVTGEAAEGTIDFSSYSDSISDDETFANGTIVFYTNSSKNSGTIYSFSNNASDGSTGDLSHSGVNPIIRVQVDNITSLRDVVSQLEHAIGTNQGTHAFMTSSYDVTAKKLTITRESPGTSTILLSGTGTPFTLDNVTYSGFAGGSPLDRMPITSFTDIGFGTSTSYTGSLINNTVDLGIPRLSGSAERRIDFDDLLRPERLFEQTIYENEPHPSSSLLYGDRMFLRTVEHDPQFGKLNQESTRAYNTTKYLSSWQRVARSLRPYRSAINNFTSETVKFFLKDERLQAITSAPAKPYLDKDTTYSMRVYLNNRDTSMYDRHSAYGPPVDEGDVSMTTYELTSNVIPGTNASGSITFLANNEVVNGTITTYSVTESCNYDENIEAINVDYAYDSYTPYDDRYFHVSGAEHGVRVNYYDSRCFTGSYVKIEFKDPSSYDSSTISNLYVSASSIQSPSGYIPNAATDGIHFSIGTPSLTYYNTISASAAYQDKIIQIPFAIYDSQTSETVAVNHMKSNAALITGSDGVQFGASIQAGYAMLRGMPFIDVRAGGGSSYKTAEEMASTMEHMLVSGTWWHPMEGTGHRIEVVRSGATISIFSKLNTKKYPAELIHFWTGSFASWLSSNENNLYTNQFSAWGTTGVNNIANVTAHDPADGHLGAIEYAMRFNTSGHTIEQVVAALESQSDTDVGAGNSETYQRYINVSGAVYSVDSSNGAYTGTSLACLTKDKLIALSSSHNEVYLSASCTIPATSDSTVLDIYRLDTGSAGNYTIVPANFTSNNWVSSMIGLEGGTNESTPLEPYLTKQTATVQDSHGYLPYVPPFLDPDTAPYAEIKFKPSDSRNYTIPEIIDGMQVTYGNSVPTPSNSSTNSNFKEAMVLSASIDFDNTVLLESDNFLHVGPPANTTVVPNNRRDFYRWIIQPKWETPVLDFQESEMSALNLSSDQVDVVTASPWKTRYQTTYYSPKAASSVPYLTASTGMWHQSGNVIAGDDKGYFLTIAGAKEYQDEVIKVGNLATAVGFLDRIESPSLLYGSAESQESKSVKLGQIAEEKRISEAVVAIPYYLTEDCDVEFFPYAENLYANALRLNNVERERHIQELRACGTDVEVEEEKKRYQRLYESPGTNTIDTAAYQIRMMDKYIFPPQFDFVRNEKVKPHVAYVFQFKSTLSREDLADIWQNMYPRSLKKAALADHSLPLRDAIESDVEYITHTLDTRNTAFIKGRESIYEDPQEFLDKDVRWIVFKAKYRAESLYSNVKKDSVSDTQEDVLEIGKVKKIFGKTNGLLQEEESQESKTFPNYSYNWPYDYFSLVELIKLESKVDFISNIDLVTQQQTVSNTPAPEQQTMESQMLAASAEVAQYETLSSVAANLDNIVTRQVLKTDTESAPSPANQLTISVDSGYSLKTGSENIYVNGMLQSVGSGEDYTISGNVVTFTYDIGAEDKVQASYIRE